MKRILIIGATSAIASACARIWAEQGATFVLVARHPKKLAQTADDLKARGATAVSTYTMDAVDFSAHQPMLKSAIASLEQIDIALLAHGTLPDQKSCEQDVKIALKEIMNNGTSVISLLTLLANQMEAQGNGTIAVISSVAGDRGRPSNYVYGTAKAAVSTFCQGLRARLFKVGVSVVDIKPGFVATPMTQGLDLPGALVAEPTQVADRITKAIERGKNTVYAPSFWALIMMIIRNIPEFVFKRLNL